MHPLDFGGCVVVMWSPEDQTGAEGLMDTVQSSATNLVSRSDTIQSGSPTSLKTNPTKLAAAISDMQVLTVGTNHTRPVKRSMCTCRKSRPERDLGNSMKSRLIMPPRRARTGRGAVSPGGKPCSALTR